MYCVYRFDVLISFEDLSQTTEHRQLSIYCHSVSNQTAQITLVYVRALYNNCFISPTSAQY